MPPPSSSSVKATKKSAFSCDPCRKRKVRCQGEQPSCSRCTARGDVCVYKLTPTISYTQTLEKRVKELELLLAEQRRTESRSGAESPRNAASPVSAAVSALPGSFEGLKLDDRGKITYHGATSFFQLPTPSNEFDGSSNDALAAIPLSDAGESRRDRLVSNAWQQRALETLSETPEPFKFLLDVHWCWIQPLFNFVYRPAFTRDMEALGPYYSHTLLNAMLSHSIRWCKNDPQIRHLLAPYDDGLLFSRQARTLLFEELRQGHSTVPTVQTLLLLSAQECSAGNRTQAWLYSGMAFRLIEDMGICIDGQKYATTVQLSDEDIEIRNRLFWSCYFWDKMVSLYLGRSPTLQHSTVSPPQMMLDDSAETEPWTPHGITPGINYVPTEAHSISCFMRMCQLSEIFNQILIHMYDPVGQNSEAEIDSCLAKEGEALRLWWQNLPSFLKIDVKTPPSQCPPSHMVTLNCLYYTFQILLHRPMLFRRFSGHEKRDPIHLTECIQSATAIIAIFDLFCKTFGEAYCILSVSYSVYIAASVFLLQVQAASGHDDLTLSHSLALRRLQFCMQALDRVKHFTPVIKNSLGLIAQALSTLNIDISKLAGLSVEQHEVTRGPEPSLNDYPVGHQSGAFAASGSLQMQPLNGFGLDGFDMSPETLDAFSYLEPMNATVGALSDFD